MLKIENVTTTGWEAAIRGMRNPLNSWHLSDSYPAVDCGKCGEVEHEGVCYPKEHDCTPYECYAVGPKDLDLMKRLRNAGTDHRKYMRMIKIYMDITANHTWWAEFDTYKVGTVRNSCSKMHKIHVKEFVKDDFDHEGIDECDDITKEVFAIVVEELERLRKLFNETKEKKYWRAIIELLPMGYRLKATVELNYEVAANMYGSRQNHKMREWKDLLDCFESLPYSELITGKVKES